MNMQALVCPCELTVSAKCRMMKAMFDMRGLRKWALRVVCWSYSFLAQFSSEPLGICKNNNSSSGNGTGSQNPRVSQKQQP